MNAKDQDQNLDSESGSNDLALVAARNASFEAVTRATLLYMAHRMSRMQRGDEQENSHGSLAVSCLIC